MPPGETPGDALTALLRNRLTSAAGDDSLVNTLVAAIRARHGRGVAAVLLYGSYLRGKRDTLLDFYVLLDELPGALPRVWQVWGNRLLPPNVYHVAASHNGALARAKYATLTSRQFRRGMGRFHSYFWSRFTQPCALVFARDAAAGEHVEGSLAAAVHTFVQRVAPTRTGSFSAGELWQTGFARTYTCELRSENRAGIGGLYEQNAAHFDAVLKAYAGQPGAAVEILGDGRYRARSGYRAATVLGWGVRRLQGKLLSVLRLVKAAGTFDDPLDYLLWKIERHSGVYLPASERQRRHPLIFAWPLLWRLYRRGAFR